MRSLLILSVFALFVAACGRSEKPKSKACTTGLNAKACSTTFKDNSIWKEEFSLTYGDKAKGEKEFSKDYTVLYEFFTNANKETMFRRSLLVKGDNHQLLGMYEQGSIQKINNDSFEALIESNSCDSEQQSLFAQPKALKIYYLRDSKFLKLNSQKITRPKKNFGSIENIIGNAIAEAIVNVLARALQSTFSFGNARNYLQSDYAKLSLTKEVPNTISNVTWGCFEYGNRFTPSHYMGI